MPRHIIRRNGDILKKRAKDEDNTHVEGAAQTNWPVEWCDNNNLKERPTIAYYAVDKGNVTIGRFKKITTAKKFANKPGLIIRPVRLGSGAQEEELRERREYNRFCQYVPNKAQLYWQNKRS